MSLKTLLTTATILLLLFSSCQSEYEIQVQRAKKLVREKAILVKNITESGYSIQIEDQIKQIQEKIEFSAQVSGNRELFYEEITAFRDQLNSDDEVLETLISKYP